MRRAFWQVPAIIFLILAGCEVDEGTVVDQGNGPPQATTAGGGTETTAGERTATIGDKIEFRTGDTVQVHAFEANIPPPDEFFQPDEGNEYAAIDVEGCASETREGGLVNPFFFQLVMPDNTSAGPAFIDAKMPALSARTQTAGDCNRGWITFEVPEGVTPAAIVFDGFTQTARWSIRS